MYNRVGNKNPYLQEDKAVVKLIIGARGSGKTKNLIELVNSAAAATKGSVICVEYGNTLNFDVTYKARLVDTTAFDINNADALYGFIAGLAASDHDITDIFVDAALKICNRDMNAVNEMVAKVKKLSDTYGFNFVMTVSASPEDCPESMRALM
jgi:alkyl hydroperoxide reductase subunit AhpF